jgi:hypothetical protein
MTWKMHPKQLENVLGLTPKVRYEYFVKRVADWQEVWGLWKDGWALLGEDGSKEFMPVWPHPEFAARYASGDWKDYSPRAIDVHEWIEEWIPKLKREGLKVAVFPALNGLFTAAEPEKVKADVKDELDKME